LTQGFAHQALAIAAGRAEDVAIKAAGVHADQDVFGRGDVAAHQRQVVFGVELAGIGDGAERAEFGIEDAFAGTPQEVFGLHPVADQLGHRQHFQMVAAQNASSWGTRAMVPSSFITSQITPEASSPAMRARSTEASVCPARTSTPPSRARRGKTWPGGPGPPDGNWGQCLENGKGAVGGGDAGADAFPGIDGFAEGGAEIRGVTLAHQGQMRASQRSAVRGRQIRPRP